MENRLTKTSKRGKRRKLDSSKIHLQNGERQHIPRQAFSASTAPLDENYRHANPLSNPSPHRARTTDRPSRSVNKTSAPPLRPAQSHRWKPVCTAASWPGHGASAPIGSSLSPSSGRPPFKFFPCHRPALVLALSPRRRPGGLR